MTSFLFYCGTLINCRTLSSTAAIMFVLFLRRLQCAESVIIAIDNIMLQWRPSVHPPVCSAVIFMARDIGLKLLHLHKECWLHLKLTFPARRSRHNVIHIGRCLHPKIWGEHTITRKSVSIQYICDCTTQTVGASAELFQQSWYQCLRPAFQRLWPSSVHRGSKTSDIFFTNLKISIFCS